MPSEDPSEPSPVMPPPELTLIVAATTRNMGIGRAGDLPWTGLKKEMAYFARVTKRTPSVDSPNPEVFPPALLSLLWHQDTSKTDV